MEKANFGEVARNSTRYYYLWMGHSSSGYRCVSIVSSTSTGLVSVIVLFFPHFRSSSVLPDAVAGITNNIPSLDTNWIDQTTKHASTLLEKLDIDLKNYKNNSIKESIRSVEIFRNDIITAFPLPFKLMKNQPSTFFVVK